jgi:hypothetical protein
MADPQTQAIITLIQDHIHDPSGPPAAAIQQLNNLAQAGDPDAQAFLSHMAGSMQGGWQGNTSFSDRLAQIMQQGDAMGAPGSRYGNAPGGPMPDPIRQLDKQPDVLAGTQPGPLGTNIPQYNIPQTPFQPAPGNLVPPGGFQSGVSHPPPFQPAPGNLVPPGGVPNPMGPSIPSGLNLGDPNGFGDQAGSGVAGQTSNQTNPHEVYGNTNSILANTLNDAEMQSSIAGIKAMAGNPDPSSNSQNNLNNPLPTYEEGMPGVPGGYAGSPGAGAGSQDLGMTGMLAGDPNGWLAKAGVTTQFLNNYNNYGDPMYLDMYAKQQGLPEWWARQNAQQFANMGSLYELQHGSPVDDPANLVNMASDLGPGGSLDQPGQYMSGTALYDNGLMQGNVAGLNAGEQLSSLTPPEQAALIKQSVGTIAQYLTSDAGAGLVRQMDRAITDWQELGAQSGGIPPVDLLTYLHSIGADNWIG